jgi:hypothetical protein
MKDIFVMTIDGNDGPATSVVKHYMTRGGEGGVLPRTPKLNPYPNTLHRIALRMAPTTKINAIGLF